MAGASGLLLPGTTSGVGGSDGATAGGADWTTLGVAERVAPPVNLASRFPGELPALLLTCTTADALNSSDVSGDGTFDDRRLLAWVRFFSRIVMLEPRSECFVGFGRDAGRSN